MSYLLKSSAEAIVTQYVREFMDDMDPRKADFAQYYDDLGDGKYVELRGVDMIGPLSPEQYSFSSDDRVVADIAGAGTVLYSYALWSTLGWIINVMIKFDSGKKMYIPQMMTNGGTDHLRMEDQ